MTGNYTDAWIMLCGSKPCAVLSQSCLTLWDPVDCRPPGFSVHGDSSSKSTRVGCHALFQEKFPTQESNAGLLQCRWLLYHLSHLESPGILEWVAYPFRGSSPPRSQTRVSHTASGVFTSWAIREAQNKASGQFSCSVVSDSLQPHELKHARSPCPSPTPGVYSNSCPSSRWCHPAILSSVIPFSSCPQSLPASGSFLMSQLFASGGKSIGVSASASILPMNTQDLPPSGWTGWISLKSKGLSRVFSNTTVQKHQFFSAQLSSQSNSHIHTWPLEKP